jgi:hypothetical protein
VSQRWTRVAQFSFVGVILGIVALGSQRPSSVSEYAHYSGNPLSVGNWISCSGQQVETVANCDVTSGPLRHVGRFLLSADAHLLMYRPHADDVSEAQLWNAVQDLLANYLLSGGHVLSGEKSFLVPIGVQVWKLADSGTADGQVLSEVVAIGPCLEKLEKGDLVGVMRLALLLPERDLRADVVSYLAHARPGARLDETYATPVEAGYLGPAFSGSEQSPNAYINARIIDADGSQRWLGLIGACWGVFMPPSAQ